MTKILTLSKVYVLNLRNLRNLRMDRVWILLKVEG